MRGNPRRVAQRPLPSMMMATCNPSRLTLCIVKLPRATFLTFWGCSNHSSAATLGPTEGRRRTALQTCALCYEIDEVAWSSVGLDPGRELYQSIPRVKYMAAVNARKLAIAPT